VWPTTASSSAADVKSIRVRVVVDGKHLGRRREGQVRVRAAVDIEQLGQLLKILQISVLLDVVAHEMGQYGNIHVRSISLAARYKENGAN
jgi:hypothetical protein